MDFLFNFGTNIVSSIVYELGKKFLTYKKQGLTEKEILDVIDSFQLSNEKYFEAIEVQNKVILLLLLKIFDDVNNLSISYRENEYFIDGNYTLSNLNDKIILGIDRYISNYPKIKPSSLSEAIWPIEKTTKEVLLNEIKQSIEQE